MSPDPLFRVKLMPDLESAPENLLYWTHHVSSLSKVIRSHIRSLTSDDLKWSIFPEIYFGVLWSVLAEFGADLLIPVDFIASRKKSSDPLRVFDLTSEIIR